MENDTTARAYEKYAGDPGENYEKYFVPVIGEPAAKRVVAAAEVEAGDRVLDLACGTGIAARMAAETTGTGSVVGVDPLPPMLETARRTAPEIDWRQGRAEEIPMEDDSVDLVVCSQGYQFFTDKSEALQEMARVLAPGGRVAIGTPGPIPDALVEISEALQNHVGPEAARFVGSVFTVHDPAEMKEELIQAGFEEVEAENEPLELRVPPPADFFWQYGNSTPLAPVLNQLDESRRRALQHEVIGRLQPFVEGDGTTIPTGFLVATGRQR